MGFKAIATVGFVHHRGYDKSGGYDEGGGYVAL